MPKTNFERDSNCDYRFLHIGNCSSGCWNCSQCERHALSILSAKLLLLSQLQDFWFNSLDCTVNKPQDCGRLATAPLDVKLKICLVSGRRPCGNRITSWKHIAICHCMASRLVIAVYLESALVSKCSYGSGYTDPTNC